MPQWRDFLERFRPAGTPGAATPRGVPADRVAEAAAELAPLLSLLDDVPIRVEQIRRRGVEQADQLRRDAGLRADAVVAGALARVKSVEAEASAQVRSSAAVEEADGDAAHAMAIEQLRARTAVRMPEYVDRVVAAARALMTDPGGQSADRAAGAT